MGIVPGNRELMNWLVDHLGRRLLAFALFALSSLGLRLDAEPDPAGVPDVFADRPALPDCGRATQLVGQVDPQGEGVDCFDAALAAGGAAELVVESHGVDGGPVFLYHRALPGGGLETFLDHRQDQYRSADWQQFVCPEARSLRDTGECEDRELAT